MEETSFLMKSFRILSFLLSGKSLRVATAVFYTLLRNFPEKLSGKLLLKCRFLIIPLILMVAMDFTVQAPFTT